MFNDVIPLNLGEKWILALWKQLKSFRKKRENELNEINNTVLFTDPLRLIEVYVEPNCQEVNPADRHDEDFFTSKQPLFKKISEFLSIRSFQQGNNQLFILSDAGMGKTSSLVIMKLLFLSSFWPKEFACRLEKLNEGTVETIRNIENKRKTLLLLDSLDEDPTAYGRTEERLLEILEATKTFGKVIITCRTQFFPDHDVDPFEIPGRIRIGAFICPSKYLSVFDDTQVSEYLEKRFPRRIFFDKNLAKRDRAKSIVARMGSLRCRPMLLSFIEDLVDAESHLDNWSEYALYKSLVLNWLIREETKTGIRAEMMMTICSRLAFEMQAHKLVRASPADLGNLIGSLEDSDRVSKLDISGRSLLNKNANGEYRFSHYSIQEFLVVYYILEIASLNDTRTIYPTDFIKKLLDANSEKINARFENEIAEYQHNVEPRFSRAKRDSNQTFLIETEVADLLTKYADQVDEIDLSSFQADFDIPTYLRRIIARHVSNRDGLAEVK
jgi:hypothetical protein